MKVIKASKHSSKKKIIKSPLKKQEMIFFIISSALLISVLYFFFYPKNTDDLSITPTNLTNIRQTINSSIDSIVSNDSDEKESDDLSPKVNGGTGSKGGYSKPVDPVILNDFFNDTDIIDLGDGSLYTLNLWTGGNCYNGSKDIYFSDSCKGEMLTEYYIEEGICISSDINCTALMMEAYPGIKSSDVGCSVNSCGGKIGGINYEKNSYCFDYISNVVKKDVCLNNTYLKEYKWNSSIGCEYNQINCLNEGFDGCFKGECVNYIYESCDSVCTELGYDLYNEDYTSVLECDNWLENTKIGGGIDYGYYKPFNDNKGCCCANKPSEQKCLYEGFTGGIFKTSSLECSNWLTENHYEDLESEFIEFGGNAQAGSCCFFESYNEDNENYLLKSKCYKNRTQTFEDYCIDIDRLIEVILLKTIYNVSEGCLYQQISCSDKYGEDSYCSNGACVVPEIVLSTDSDGGEDYFTKGICFDGESHEDSCYGRATPYTSLKEWYVNRTTNECSYKVIACSTKLCSDGRCVYRI